MGEVLKGALGGAWTWLMGFVFPAALLVVAITSTVLLVYPHLEVSKALKAWSLDVALVAAGFLSVAIATLLSGLNTQLYRMLEGYTILPKIGPLWGWAVGWQSKRRTRLESERDALESDTSAGAGIRLGLLTEQINQYPESDDQIGPTRIANSIRALETYAASRFGLDSQILWNELVSCAPEPARNEEASARSYVDYLVNLLYLTLIYAIGSIALFIFSPQAIGFALCVGSILAVFVWRLLIVRAVSSWAGAVRSIVNLSRMDVARAFDLKIPKTHVEEVAMWTEVNYFVNDGPSETGNELDAYRINKPGRRLTRGLTAAAKTSTRRLTPGGRR